MKKIIETDAAPAAIGPYSQAVETNGTIYVSGQLPIDPTTGTMPADIAAQTAQSIANIEAILRAAGCGLSNVVKTTVLLADMADFAAMNEIYAARFTAPAPARACYQVARLPKDARVEIEAIAVK
ncbi:MAG: RidA family protein [Rikenellaceae bacterium]|jgi:2-iminobutanoate/2-iminopropanoate deaminase|nr:RidA family protein [Rikenellaceae bacterium]